MKNSKGINFGNFLFSVILKINHSLNDADLLTPNRYFNIDQINFPLISIILTLLSLEHKSQLN